MKIYIKVKDDRIDDIRFQTFGCGAAIATSSMVTEMVKGLSLEEALKVSNRSVAEALGGLPANKMHCSNLAADALHKAIEDYRAKRSAVAG
jgi:nitrogen fixation protein NifU and related proteins